MYAIVRENTYHPEKLAQGQKQFEEFQALHAGEPGYRGTLVIDTGGGHWLTVNLWESEEHARTALPRLIPEVQRLLEPMMADPPRLVGTGLVVMTDLTRA